MISVTAAIQQIAACRTSWGTESVPLEGSAGRVLAEVITTDRDYPPFQRAARDGFAIRSEDVQVLLEPGLRLNLQHPGLLASLGVMNVKVQRPPRVMFIAVGNELRMPGTPVNDMQLRDANGFTLTGLLTQYGIGMEAGYVVPEHPDEVRSVVRSCLEADLLVICGNVQPKTIVDCGVEQVFSKVKAHPCSSFWFGYSPTRTRVMLMPGEPFAVQAACKLFVESYIRSCYNIPLVKPWLLPHMEHRTPVFQQDEFVPAALVSKNGLKVKALSFQGRAGLSATALADGMICHSAESGSLEPSALVPFYPWVETA